MIGIDPEILVFALEAHLENKKLKAANESLERDCSSAWEEVEGRDREIKKLRNET